MLRFEDIKFDCRLYNGYKPCIYGNNCPGCPFYDPLDAAHPGWTPTLSRGAIAALPPEPKILIIKTGALGDVLRTTTLLHPIRRAFPRAHITWITAPAALPLLAHNPYIDELTAFEGDSSPGISSEAEPFDLSICLEKEGFPLAYAARVNATHRTGYYPTPWGTATVANEEARYMMLLGVNDELKFFKNRQSYPQIICEAVGLEFQRDPYILETTQVAANVRDKTLAAVSGNASEPAPPAGRLPVVGLNTGCGAVFRTKQWTLEGWAATARALVESGDAHVILMGGPAEAELNQAIMEQVPGLIDSGTNNPLEDFFGIIDACDIVVTSDSLGMHIAIARQKYVVALFGSTSHNEIDLYDRGQKVITDFPCSPCYLKTCDKKPTCMEDMSASTVLSAVHDGLAEWSARNGVRPDHADHAVEPVLPAPAVDDPADAATPGRRAWMIFTLTLGLAFLVPMIMLMKPAAQPATRAAHAIQHGFVQMDNEEGALLYQAMQLRQGMSIYRPLNNPPYVAGTYTPLYMAAVAAVDDFSPPTFSRGRTIVWISALMSAILLVLMTLSITRNVGLGVLAGFLFLGTWETYRWIGYFRVDFPAIFLSIAGLTLLVFCRRARFALSSAALLMVMALFTKQTMIAAPVAAVISLFFRRPKDSLKFIGWLLFWGVPTVIVLHVLTNGQFLRHTFLYNINAWNASDVAIWWRHILRMHRWFFSAAVVALPFLVVGLVIQGRRDWRSRTKVPTSATVGTSPPDPVNFLNCFWQPLAIYAILAQWNILAIGKAGSAENYLLEPIAGWAVIITLTAGAGLRIMGQQHPLSVRAAVAPPVAALLALLTAYASHVNDPVEFQMRFTAMQRAGGADLKAASQIRTLVSQARNPYTELAIYNLHAHRPPVLQPFIMSELARQGKWDESTFVAQVRDAAFDLVVTQEDVTAKIHSQNYTDAMLQAFHSAYQVRQVILTPLWQYYILTPRDQSSEPLGNQIAGR